MKEEHEKVLDKEELKYEALKKIYDDEKKSN